MIPRFKPKLGWSEFLTLFKPNSGAVRTFEMEFAKAFQAVDAVSFPYGRSAQWAFFNALGIEQSEIIMPAYTCSVVAHAVSLSDNTPVFIDVKNGDFNMDLDLVENAITDKTGCIIATHTFGYPQDIDRLEKIVHKAEKKHGHKIWLMQDCCHAFDAEWNGKMIGTSGDTAVYAFNISKLMTSIFGGMLTFQDQELASKVRTWRNVHYKKPGALKGLKRRLYLLAIYIAFHPLVYGFTWWLQERTSLLNSYTKSFHLDGKIHFPPDYLVGMSNVEAAVGLVQLKKYPQIIENRRDLARWYDNNLERKEGWIFPPIREGATYSHYVVQVPNRKEVIDEYASRGIELGELIQYSIPELPEYEWCHCNCTNTDRMTTSNTNFPIHSNQVKKSL